MNPATRYLSRGLDRALAVLRRISSAGVWVGGGLLTVLALATGAEVLSRRLLSHSLGGIDELGGYTLAVVGAVAMTEALLNRAHIRIGVLHGRLGRRGQSVLDLVSLGALMAFFGIVLWFGWALLARNYGLGTRSMTPLATPLWIPQALWVLAFAVFWLVAVALLLRSCIGVAEGDWETVNELIGLRETEDEVADGRAIAEHAASVPGTGPDRSR
ncbi:TRAP-type mannitol/chloroaromatic compound transport system permease small subunit [Palleronia aestuarii]|uniref:TRAP transporter small permease protein n=1 Tax=Palleronia aestuarii TaxID=568105 RepID=A0A2W7NHB6_9RHOB|nr:TRAP transporter small permease subunit [Palleronia aestuarii]PZX10662.1 TRAP-type mannitol/chloroaromatic compound transport system permease small subunit [Palleronia aestuarii]